MFQEYVLFCFVLLLLFIETQWCINISYMNVTLKCRIYVSPTGFQSIKIHENINYYMFKMIKV